MIKKIYYSLVKIINSIKFRKTNKHNNVKLLSLYPINNIKIGKGTYGDLNIRAYNKNGKITIGNYCSIADKVEFLVGGDHNYKRISTYPFQSRVYKQSTKDIPNYDIVVEDDVWIGYECLIMSNSHIGKGCVIGARSIVTGDIPPYSVYIGNKVYKKRFPDEIIAKADKIDFSKINHTINDDYSSLCQTEITLNNIDEIISNFEK